MLRYITSYNEFFKTLAIPYPPRPGLCYFGFSLLPDPNLVNDQKTRPIQVGSGVSLRVRVKLPSLAASAPVKQNNAIG